MTYNPLVSAIIPAYNAAQFLSQTIQSVLNQSYRNWELLVVDDGSTDDTAEIVRRYHDIDERVRLISKANGGVSAARNTGVEAAQGELIAFLDADDLWCEDKLKVHVDYSQCHPAVSATFARVELINLDGSSINRLTRSQTGPVDLSTLFYTNPTVTTSNLVVRKNAFLAANGFDESMRHDEDVDFLFRLVHQDDSILSGIGQVLVKYRLHDYGLSSDLAKMEQGWVKLMQKAYQKVPAIVDQHYNAAHSCKLQYLARQTLRLNMPASLGVSFINRAVACDWTSIYKRPKVVVIALLLYLRLATFNTLKINV